jgi:hypothetical protein
MKPPVGGWTPGRRALVASLASLVLWSAFYLQRVPSHPMGDLSGGAFTDHVSHLNAARLFPRVGADVWRRPLTSMFAPLPPQLRALVQPGVTHPDAYFVPGWPLDKPMVQGWASFPRMYPPGDMLVVAPVALAYHFTPLSFRDANRALVLLYLALAHVTVWLILRAALSSPAESPAARAAFVLAAYALVVYWSLEGFYDGLAIAPLVVAAAKLQRGRGVAALVAYCAAAALHFRALYFAPWALYAAWLAWNERPWDRRAVAGLAVAAALAIAALYPFALVWPAVRTLPQNAGVTSANALAAFAAVLVLSGAALVWARAWLDCAVLAWLAVMLYAVRAHYAWYSVFLLPWLLAPVVGSRRQVLVGDARFVAVAAWALIVFGYPVVPGLPLVLKLAG